MAKFIKGFLIFAVIGIVLSYLAILTSTIWKVEYVTATVTKTYIDTSKEQSYYMVYTDKGIFEVDKGLIIGFQPDAIFGSIKADSTYKFKTRGLEFVNFFSQRFPYITKVTPVLTQPNQSKSPASTTGTSSGLPLETWIQLPVGTYTFTGNYGVATVKVTSAGVTIDIPASKVE